jgi:hypothetical protein
MRSNGPREIIVALGVVAAAAACTLDFDRFRGEAAPDTADVIDAPDATGVSSGDPPSDPGSPEPSTIDAGDASIDAIADAPVAPSCDEPGLVARFGFDEGAGATVNDCSSSKHAGSVVGAPVWTSGHAGGALALDGAYVSLGSAPKLDVKGAFTAAAWIRVTSFPKKPSAYVFGKTASIYQGGWRLGLEPSAVSFAVSRGPAKAELQTEAPLPATGTWVHVAGVFQPGSGVTIFVGGVQAGTNTTDPPAAVPPMTSDLRVGVRGDGDPSTYFRGTVDDVRLYARALSPLEIAALAAP